MKYFVSLIFAIFALPAFSYNDFGPLVPNETSEGGLVWVDLGSGAGGLGGRWFQCYGSHFESPLDYAICGADSNPYAAYEACVSWGWVNITCQITRL